MKCHSLISVSLFLFSCSNFVGDECRKQCNASFRSCSSILFAGTLYSPLNQPPEIVEEDSFNNDTFFNRALLDYPQIKPIQLNGSISPANDVDIYKISIYSSDTIVLPVRKSSGSAVCELFKGGDDDANNTDVPGPSLSSLGILSSNLLQPRLSYPDILYLRCSDTVDSSYSIFFGMDPNDPNAQSGRSLGQFALLSCLSMKQDCSSLCR
ncbi:hypothetical protein CH379_003185 [Leptospira ellisii]|uniref:Lipoprotein n=1 Tax=Leptospira ellisii TaxID=2023197 RepID=A0A2N0B9A1_9LEPT|nr:hypothetical protein [Leptospira ellisii]MDV6234631.1 hypothetical protein [Leptospira ellisii]PJZ93106.1 hypothetical protein CH379_09570 [Leptospira ellisii]PKA06040.1 hypothetical protein CH375_01845 [Leptospira ellisii]